MGRCGCRAKTTHSGRYRGHAWRMATRLAIPRVGPDGAQCPFTIASRSCTAQPSGERTGNGEGSNTFNYGTVRSWMVAGLPDDRSIDYYRLLLSMCRATTFGDNLHS
eukprot:5329708-Pyramimonas_sp.AAC.1